jgi:hypothetical protein
MNAIRSFACLSRVSGPLALACLFANSAAATPLLGNQLIYSGRIQTNLPELGGALLPGLGFAGLACARHRYMR